MCEVVIKGQCASGLNYNIESTVLLRTEYGRLLGHSLKG
jgi:hypothetical protein